MYSCVTKSQTANQLDEYQSTNRNFRLTSCSDTDGNNVSTLVSAADYKTYMDLAVGKRVANPILDGAEAYSLDGKMGAFYKLNVQPGVVISTLDASNGSAPFPDVSGGNGMMDWPNNSQIDAKSGIDQYIASANDNYKGYVLDPYNRRTKKCSSNLVYHKTIDISPILDIDGRWLSSYWKARSAQPLSGFSFPTKVHFGYQQTNYNNDLVVKAAPMTKAVNVSTVSTSSNQGAFDNIQALYCGTN